MPDGLGIPALRDDPYAWAQAQAAALKSLPGGSLPFDQDGLIEFLEESAHDMLAGVKSQLINLMTHLAKSALTRNQQVVGHWRSECRVFHQEVIINYRRSMRKDIDLEKLWRYASTRVIDSFAAHGEPTPNLPKTCPFTLAELVDEDLDIAATVERLRDHWQGDGSAT